MKKLFVLTLVLVFSSAGFRSLAMVEFWALTSETAQVQEMYDDAIVSIPEYVRFTDRERKVVKVNHMASLNNETLRKLWLPATLTRISTTAVDFIQRDCGSFEGCINLTYVNMPSCEVIGVKSFFGCSGLTSITLPQNLTTIYAQAFRGCTGLKSITIPNSVVNLGLDAFYGCSGLTYVCIGKQAEETGFSAGKTTSRGWAFEGCNNIKKVAYPSSWDPVLTSAKWDGILAITYDKETAGATADGCIYSDDGKILYCVPLNISSFEIPEGVTTICKNAFSLCELESLSIPSSVTHIEADAFADCTIGEVHIADWDKWYNNVKLDNYNSNPYRENTDVYAGGVKISSFSLNEGMTTIPDYVQCGFSFKDEIELPSTLKRIGACAFFNNKELYKVSMPEGLEEIGQSAFEGCELLENPQLPSFLHKIEDSAFKNCSSITEVSLPENLTYLGNSVFANNAGIEKAILVTNLDELSNNLFENCPSLNKVFFPLQLRKIGNDCFNGCKSLDEVTFPSTLEIIGQNAFAHCSFSKITIPKNVTTIQNGAFEGNSLVIINLPDGLKYIGEKSFANNPSISSVVLPQSVISLGANAFFGSNICDFTVSDNLTDLPSGSCGSPAIITVGSGVKNISGDAFSFDNLHVIRMKASTPPNLTSALNITSAQNDGLTMIVNDGQLNNYQRNARWKQIDNIVEQSSSDIVIYMTGDYTISEEIRTTTGLMPANVTRMKVVGPLTSADMRLIKENMISLISLDLSAVTNLDEIPEGQFQNKALTEVTLPENLKTIGANAFANCQTLSLTELPEGITSIGDKAFSNSPQIALTKLPSSLHTIGINIFENCLMIESIDLSETSLTEIPANAFRGCKNLDEITLPETITSIGENAFKGTAIRDIAFAEKALVLGANAFSDCHRLVAANMPSNVTSINTGLFANCQRMIAASFSSETIRIAANVFNGNNKLANISCAAVEAPDAEPGAFDGTRTRYVSLTVPTLSYRSYLNAPQWGKFQSIQNRIPITIDNGVDVTNIAEEEFQEMVTEDELEAAAEASAQDGEQSQIIARRLARRAAARANTYDGRQFAALFNGAQIQTGNDGKGTRIFINPKSGVNVTSILFNGEEMLNKLDGNSLLLPARSSGSLIIKTDCIEENSIEVIEVDDKNPIVYNLRGQLINHGIDDLPAGLYIIRQGSTTKKVAIK